MMQPILLNNQPTPKDSERFSELSASDKSLKVGDQLSSDVKLNDNFSGLLGSAIKGSDKSEVKITALNSLIKPKANNKTGSPEISLIKNISADTKTDPIMAQIETAQKANTTLSAPKKSMQEINGSLNGSVLLQEGITTEALTDNESQLKSATVIGESAGKVVDEDDSGKSALSLATSIVAGADNLNSTLTASSTTTGKLKAPSDVSNNLNDAVKSVDVLSDVITSKSEPSITSQTVDKQLSNSDLLVQTSLDDTNKNASIIKKSILKPVEKDQVNISSIKINQKNIALAGKQDTSVNSFSDIQPLDTDAGDSESVADQESSPLQAVHHGVFSAKSSPAKNVEDGNLEQVEPIRRGLFTSQISDNSAPAKLTTSQTDLLDVNDKLDHESDDTDISQVLAAGFVSQPVDLEQVKSASNGISEQTVNAKTGAETIAGTNFPKSQSTADKSTQSLKLNPNAEIDGKAKLVSAMNTGQNVEDNDLSTKLEKLSQKSNKFRDLFNQNKDLRKIDGYSNKCCSC